MIRWEDIPGCKSIPEAKTAMIKGLKYRGIPVTDVKTSIATWKGRRWLALESWKTSQFDCYKDMPEDRKWMPVLDWSFHRMDPTRMGAAICLAA